MIGVEALLKCIQWRPAFRCESVVPQNTMLDGAPYYRDKDVATEVDRCTRFRGHTEHMHGVDLFDADDMPTAIVQWCDWTEECAHA